MVRRLVRDGCRRLSAGRMEMSIAMDDFCEHSSATEVLVWQQGQRVARVLREIVAVDPSDRGERPMVPSTHYEGRTTG